MLADHFNERVQKPTSVGSPTCSLIRRAVMLMVLMGLVIGVNRGWGAETSLAEYRVKSLFLFNFATYVDWPANAFATASAPFVIGLIGDEKFAAVLAQTVEGKTVSGRRIVMQPIETEDDFGKCHILFIDEPDQKRLGEILDKVKTLPVLTVGETDRFMERGGVINLVKRQGKVRLDINLDAARQAQLAISVRLLSVADVVKGKAN
ncbi:MAG TPA: YfiR family protein [Methylomirabilota bacterium]|nr:YfiR family protein [Methylomirabilota bacterium]